MKLRPDQEAMFEKLVTPDNIDTFKQAVGSAHPVNQISSEDTLEVLESLTEDEYNQVVSIVALEIGVPCG